MSSWLRMTPAEVGNTDYFLQTPFFPQGQVVIQDNVIPQNNVTGLHSVYTVFSDKRNCSVVDF